MESVGELHALLPDLQSSICENFSNVECSIEKTPHLSEAPFNFSFDTIGRKIHLLPSGSTLPKDFHLLVSVPEGDVISDTQAAETIHLVLGGGDDWRTPIQRLFNKKNGSEWSLLVLELQSGNAHFEVLSPSTKPVAKQIISTVLWMIPICAELPPKPRVVKKILVKKSPEKTSTSTSTSSAAGSVTKVTKTPNGTKIIRKKIIAKDAQIVCNGDSKEKSPSERCTTPKKLPSSNSNNTNNSANGNGEKTGKSREVTKKPEKTNGDGSGVDSGVSMADSDNEKSQKVDLNVAEGNDQENDKYDTSMNEWVTPCTTPDSGLKLMQQQTEETSTTNSRNNMRSDDDMLTSFTLTLSPNETNAGTEEANKMDSASEEGTKHRLNNHNGDSGMDMAYEATQARHISGGGGGISEDRCSPAFSSSSSRFSPPSDASDRVFDAQKVSNNQRQKLIPMTAREHDMQQCNGNVQMPVQVLQQVLKQFTYKELGELRRVHPHWDELCGQLLNSGYYELVKKADKMLSDCQRRVHNERQLHDVLSSLTNVQVHILNPIDILRPAMDEGVCCFIYGDLLDKLFDIMAKAKRMMEGEYDLVVDWKSVADLSRRAQIHYKTNLATIMEEKLSDVVRLKALQRIQRIDSFIVDSTVVKLEKAAHMARDEMEWEIEQLRQQNAQLRKDNRDLRKDYMRLESRIEVLENKFKTMARLLQ